MPGFCIAGRVGVVIAPASSDIVADADYYFPCVAFSKNGRPVTITWIIAGEEISNSVNLVHVYEKNGTENGINYLRSVLELSCASVADAVEYTCRATDGLDSSEQSFTLHFTCKRPTQIPQCEFIYHNSSCSIP